MFDFKRFYCIALFTYWFIFHLFAVLLLNVQFTSLHDATFWIQQHWVFFKKKCFPIQRYHTWNTRRALPQHCSISQPIPGCNINKILLRPTWPSYHNLPRPNDKDLGQFRRDRKNLAPLFLSHFCRGVLIHLGQINLPRPMAEPYVTPCDTIVPIWKYPVQIGSQPPCYLFIPLFPCCIQRWEKVLKM